MPDGSCVSCLVEWQYVLVGRALVRLSDAAQGLDLFLCCDILTQLVLVQLQLEAVWGACAAPVFWQAQQHAHKLHPCIRVS